MIRLIKADGHIVDLTNAKKGPPQGPELDRLVKSKANLVENPRLRQARTQLIVGERNGPFNRTASNELQRHYGCAVGVYGDVLILSGQHRIPRN